MEKEIQEQPAVVRKILNEYILDQKISFESLENTRTTFANASIYHTSLWYILKIWACMASI